MLHEATGKNIKFLSRMSLQNRERNSSGIDAITTIAFKHAIAEKNIGIGNI